MCCICMLPGCPCSPFCCLPVNARIKRVLQKFPAVLPTNALPNGSIQKVVGRAQMAPGQILMSPVSNKPCVQYSVTVQERQKRGDHHAWVTIVEELVTVDFFLSDDTGGSVFVQGTTVKSFSLEETSSTGGGFWGGTAASPGLESLMQRHGRSSTGFFGGTKNLRVTETSFDLGEVLACLGGVNPGIGGPTSVMSILQEASITEEYATANNWNDWDKKSWSALTGKYQCVLMSDSAELTENILAPQLQAMYRQQQPMMIPQQQQPMMIQQQQQPMMIPQQQQPMMIPQQQQPVMIGQPVANMAQVAPAPMLMTVTVPQGVAPGQQLQLQTPAGTMVMVTVPPGVGPGGQFQIQC